MTSPCDGCGKPRRPYRYERDEENPHGLVFCFLCVKEGERYEKTQAVGGQEPRP